MSDDVFSIFKLGYLVKIFMIYKYEKLFYNTLGSVSII